VPVPLISSFAEINVRTYVTRNGKPGIWFLSLDTPNALAVLAARRAYRLPYERARIAVQRRDGWFDYASARRGQDARFVARYRGAGPVWNARPGSFEHFMAERYCLYTLDDAGNVLRGDIHHAPWPLQAAEVELASNTMALPYGIDLAGEPRAHYADRLDVLFWTLERD
jgi:uncharacterized protein YqjF (DUF2071 family)